MNEALNAFLAAYSREAREIALCLRTLVLDVFSNAFEQIDPRSGIIAYGFNKTSEYQVCAIAPHMKHVNLLFINGAQLPDPSKLLSGTGKCARHVRITSEAETENPALRVLLREAFKVGFKH